jgi:hypothetical protein
LLLLYAENKLPVFFDEMYVLNHYDVSGQYGIQVQIFLALLWFCFKDVNERKRYEFQSNRQKVDDERIASIIQNRMKIEGFHRFC